ncbi:MAG TPA: hypothetical protein VE981_24145 [Planctomycetota bacterium]|nr:hypothetical protein [Planctomycetota bacterium]
MAILVRYERNELERAIYLSQSFYRLIHRKARQEGSGYSVLRDVALLKYKSPTLTIGGDRLGQLVTDLQKLSGATILGRKEVSDFLAICEKAAANGQALWVSGDMYPEL